MKGASIRLVSAAIKYSRAVSHPINFLAHIAISVPHPIMAGRGKRSRGADESPTEGRKHHRASSSSESYTSEDDFDHAEEVTEEERPTVEVEPPQTSLSGDEEAALAAQVTWDADLVEE